MKKLKVHYAVEIPKPDYEPEAVYVSACDGWRVYLRDYYYSMFAREVTCGNCRRTNAFKEAPK